MCLDATHKADVRGHGSTSLTTGMADGNSQMQNIKNQFPEIVGVNDSLLSKRISVVFISIKKNRKNHIKELNERLFSLKEFSEIKFVIYLEEVADISDIKNCIWRFANNFDPKRDSFLVPRPLSLVLSGIGLDGTRKTKQHDNFERPWPNIICADEATIKSVDEKWSKMFSPSLTLPEGERTPFPSGRVGDGLFIPSPSLKYQKQLYKGGAVAEE